MKGLILAYSFPPNPGVGALRPAYWARHFKDQHNVDIEVISAYRNEEKQEYTFHHVPLKSKSSFSAIIKDEGLRWRHDVIRYLNRNPITDLNFVIITGGPFFHFSLSKYFKNQGVKVYLDFRDPFSYNPRLKEKRLKKWIKQRFEYSATKHANALIAVNAECHNYIAPKNQSIKRWIIPNGFNDEIDSNKKEVSQGLFYAGKFYWEPISFFDVLQNLGLTFKHAGEKIDSNHEYIRQNKYEYFGYLNQADLYDKIAESDIGVVFTMDIPFESTTKIYDYIALNKKILIITKGKPGEGALKRELDKYPYHKWVSNNKADITNAIIELQKLKVEEFNPYPYSRKHALHLLNELICND